MKQVYLLTLFVPMAFAVKAQNFSPAAAASSICQPASYYLGEKYKGVWTSYYANGNRCDSGYLLENKPDGIWKSWHPNGQLRMEMECSAKKLTSTKDEMERIYRPGYSPAPNQRQMNQVVNTAHPYDKLVYRQLYIAIHPPNMDEDYSEVKVQVQSGDQVNSFQTTSPPFTEALIHGTYKTYFENGQLKDSGYCANGIRDGVWEEWDENVKMKAVGFYKNGLRWKDWRYYNKEGKLEYIKWYNRQEEVTETIVLK
jgi:uncharacterized protein